MVIFILCLKMFFARILDVSLGVIRTVATVKEQRILATVIAFMEVFIWFMIAREALNTEISSIFIPLSYAGGYAAGTFIGMILSKILISGIIGIQVITDKIDATMIDTIRKNGFALSIIDIEDETHAIDKKMLLIQVNSGKLRALTNLIKSLDEKAFIIVNETKYVQNGFIK